MDFWSCFVGACAGSSIGAGSDLVTCSGKRARRIGAAVFDRGISRAPYWLWSVLADFASRVGWDQYQGRVGIYIVRRRYRVGHYAGLDANVYFDPRRAVPISTACFFGTRIAGVWIFGVARDYTRAPRID